MRLVCGSSQALLLGGVVGAWRIEWGSTQRVCLAEARTSSWEGGGIEMRRCCSSGAGNVGRTSGAEEQL